MSMTDIQTSGSTMFEAVDMDGEFLRINVDEGVAQIGDYAMQSDTHNGVMAGCHLDIHAMKMLRAWLDVAIPEAEQQAREHAEENKEG